MRYFTPNLFLRGNGTDDKEAELADEAWEQAITQYKRSLKEQRSKMPPNVRTLAEKCCFHDARLLGWQTHEKSNGRKANVHRMLTLGLQNDDETIVLYYFLCASPKESKRPKHWPFSQDRKHWLYDEVGLIEQIDRAGGGCEFVHRILWSDGSELEVPFADVIVDRFPSLLQVST
jgi:hypothetical protein